MLKPYLVLVNGLLWDRKLTLAGAENLVRYLKEEKGLNATIAYSLEEKVSEYQKPGIRA
jgi:hypothetical protein